MKARLDILIGTTNIDSISFYFTKHAKIDSRKYIDE